jgi:hypothetical protein
MHLGVKKPNPKFELDILIHQEGIQVLIISDFSDSAHFLQLQIDNFCTVHSPSNKKFRSVESFKLSFRVSGIHAFIFIYF